MMRILAPLMLCACLAQPGIAIAQAIESTGQSYARISLAGGRIAPDGSRTLGLVIDLAPGWKTYWRSPGEAGIPPRFDWSGSSNIATPTVLWPRPEVFRSFGLETVGYSGRVVLPVRVRPEDPGRPVGVSLGVRLGVCRDICVLESVHLSARFAPGAKDRADLVSAALEAVPVRDQGLVARVCTLTGDGQQRELKADLTFASPVRAPQVLMEGPPGAWFQETTVIPEGDVLHIHSSMMTGGTWLSRGAIRMTVLGADGFAADIRGCE